MWKFQINDHVELLRYKEFFGPGSRGKITQRDALKGYLVLMDRGGGIEMWCRPNVLKLYKNPNYNDGLENWV